MEKTIRQEIIDIMLGSSRVLLAGHTNPDGDSLGSLLGLAGMLKGAGIQFQIVNEGKIPEKYRFLPGIKQVTSTDSLAEIQAQFDTAVIVECSNLERIGEVRRLISEDCLIINIDHHQDNVPFGKVNLRLPEVSSAGEMIYDILVQGKITIDREMATSLYTAILTDTGRFHYNNTTPRCLRIAADLIDLGADPVVITEKIYFRKTPARLHLIGLMLTNMAYLVGGKLCVMTLDRQMMASTGAENGDTEGLVNHSLSAAGVEVGVLFSEIGDRLTKVSLRSQDRIDVAAIASHYGGGGHHNASGFTINQPLANAKEQVIKYIEERLNDPV